MALGTLASRGTGFLRTLVLVIALGQATLSDAYNNSNTLPNTVYYLMLGGIFTSVVVPMLVRAAKEDPDRGEGYAKRIYSLGVVSLLVVTVVATALSGPIVDLYAATSPTPASTTPWWCSPTSSSRRSSSTGWTRCSARSSTCAAGSAPTCGRRSSTTSWSSWSPSSYMATEHRHQCRHRLHLRPLPARDRHHARHRDPVGLPLPRHVARRVQHAADLRLPARGDLRDRPDVRLDVRLRGDPVARQPGRASGWRTPPGTRPRTCIRRSPASASPPTPTAWQLFQLPYAIVGHLGHQRAAAPDERARDRPAVLAGARRLLQGRPGRVGHRGARRGLPRRARRAAVRVPVRPREDHDGPGPVHRRGVRRVLASGSCRSCSPSFSCGCSTRSARTGPRRSSAWSCSSSA